MNINDATSLGMASKKIYRFMTAPNASAAGRILALLPDGLDPNGRTPAQLGECLMQAAAAKAPERRYDGNILRQVVEGELRRRGIPVPFAIDGATQQLRQQQRGWTDQERHWQQVDDWAAGLTDDEASDWTMYALTQLPDEPTRDFFQKRSKTVRDSRPLRGLAYEYVRAQEAFR